MRVLLPFFMFLYVGGHAQMRSHFEARICGLGSCRSFIAEVQSPFVGLWIRGVNYPSSMMSAPDFPGDRGELGYTLLVEVGLPQAKVVVGNVDGEWVKGIHVSGEDEDGRFRSHLILYHRPPSARDAFRLDGELAIEYFSGKMNSNGGGRSPEMAIGGMLRIECYEPAPIAFHTGLAIKRTSSNKKKMSNTRKSGGDFIDSLDPYFLNSFKSRAGKTDWTCSMGPTMFMDWSVGGNLTLRYLF